nr:carbon monoxide dehydrogenase [Desulfobacterales bacterium]
MGYTIAFAGKGGTGKTTLAGLMIRYLLKARKKPILAVDADSNSNLNEVLGLEVETTLGEAREEMKRGIASGMTKDIFMEMKVEEALVESEGFDLIVMGRPEGPGCYCAANNLLSQYIQRLSKNYPYIVIDNEAGMEHISRLTTKEIDLLVIVSDPTRRGIQAAKRIHELTRELTLRVDDEVLIVNQVENSVETSLVDQIGEKAWTKLTAIVPKDTKISEFDMRGEPTMYLPEDSPALKAAFSIYEEIVP